MNQLEQEGRTTATIRNRSRRRKARMKEKGRRMGGADIPNLFACCGVGLAFGDATEEHYDSSRQHEHQQYEEQKKQKETREAQLRDTYRKALKTKVNTNNIEESYEIVE
jgi:hypothetical protein